MSVKVFLVQYIEVPHNLLQFVGPSEVDAQPESGTGSAHPRNGVFFSLSPIRLLFSKKALPPIGAKGNPFKF